MHEEREGRVRGCEKEKCGNEPELEPGRDCHCGHAHDVENDPACDCGHDREHGHGHDHEHDHDDCACGHDHSHASDIGHDHEHERDHKACACDHSRVHDPNDPSDQFHHAHSHEPGRGSGGLTVREHGGALVLQTAWESRGDEAAARAKLADAMLEIGNRVNESGGLIGHIKAAFTGPVRGAMLSMTDDRVNDTPFFLDTLRVELTVIVYAVGRAALTGIVKEAVRTHCGKALS